MQDDICTTDMLYAESATIRVIANLIHNEYDSTNPTQEEMLDMLSAFDGLVTLIALHERHSETLAYLPYNDQRRM